MIAKSLVALPVRGAAIPSAVGDLVASHTAREEGVWVAALGAVHALVVDYKYSSNNSMNGVWLYKHKNSHSWDVDDINLEEEIWDFFTKYVMLNNTSINSPIFNLKRKIIRTVNLLGQNVFDIKNKFVLNIYDDGSVEKVILVE